MVYIDTLLILLEIKLRVNSSIHDIITYGKKRRCLSVYSHYHKLMLYKAGGLLKLKGASQELSGKLGVLLY